MVVNSHDAKWQHDANDPPGGESLVLRTDRKTGAMEFFARYPAGFAFKPHAHKANERFMLMEGKAAVEVGDAKTRNRSGRIRLLSGGADASNLLRVVDGVHVVSGMGRKTIISLDVFLFFAYNVGHGSYQTPERLLGLSVRFS